MTDIFVVQVAPNLNGQGDGLGPSAAPAPPIPPCTKVPWLCPTVHNPYYNYFSNLRCGQSSDPLSLVHISVCTHLLPI